MRMQRNATPMYGHDWPVSKYISRDKETRICCMEEACCRERTLVASLYRGIRCYSRDSEVDNIDHYRSAQYVGSPTV